MRQTAVVVGIVVVVLLTAWATAAFAGAGSCQRVSDQQGAVAMVTGPGPPAGFCEVGAVAVTQEAGMYTMYALNDATKSDASNVNMAIKRVALGLQVRESVGTEVVHTA